MRKVRSYFYCESDISYHAKDGFGPFDLKSQSVLKALALDGTKSLGSWRDLTVEHALNVVSDERLPLPLVLFPNRQAGRDYMLISERALGAGFFDGNIKILHCLGLNGAGSQRERYFLSKPVHVFGEGDLEITPDMPFNLLDAVSLDEKNGPVVLSKGIVFQNTLEFEAYNKSASILDCIVPASLGIPDFSAPEVILVDRRSFFRDDVLFNLESLGPTGLERTLTRFSVISSDDVL